VHRSTPESAGPEVWVTRRTGGGWRHLWAPHRRVAYGDLRGRAGPQPFRRRRMRDPWKDIDDRAPWMRSSMGNAHRPLTGSSAEVRREAAFSAPVDRTPNKVESDDRQPSQSDVA
jgi:hypothetical protein